ncbi:MAG: glycosyltransferase [Gammaproteobacteria bacterium]|nr:glycosyltransferase [Gammaproteobacteria bacterium]
MSFKFLPSTRAVYAPMPSPRRGGPKKRLLFLGRWHPNKGVDLLMSALAEDTDGDWARIEEFCIAGGGPLESNVHDSGVRLSAAGRPLRIEGYLDVEQARAALAAADLLVIPSRIESIPLVFSDGVRAGCAIVATPVGDLALLVDGETPCGVVATSTDPEAIAAAIREALVQPKSAFARGIADRASQFSLKNVAGTLVSLMDSVDGH